MTRGGRWRAWLVRRPAQVFTPEDAAELAGLLAALSRAGLAPGRTWQILSEHSSAVAVPARQVTGMLELGGSVPDGLALAAQHAHGPGAQVLVWLRITAQMAERTGAPAAAVYDGLVRGIDEELEQAQELSIALAGPRATAAVLAALPLAGLVLALLMGVNSLAVLTGTTVGRACLTGGVLLWLAGQRWMKRLLGGVR
jgi:tight adherence protein B